jgi:hypothetical protein
VCGLYTTRRLTVYIAHADLQALEDGFIVFVREKKSAGPICAETNLGRKHIKMDIGFCPFLCRNKSTLNYSF